MTRAAAGGLAILGAAALWGGIGVLSTGLFRAGVSPWEVAFWRAAISGLLLLLYLAVFRREDLRLGTVRDAGPLLGFGVVGVALFYASFQLATYLTSVAVAVVLLYLAPVFVMVGAAVWLDEPLTSRKSVMAVLVVAGVWATALGAAGARVRVTPAGIAWGLLSAVSYAAYYLFGKRYVPRYGVPRTLVYSLLVGALLLWPVTALAGHRASLSLPLAAWGQLLALSLGATLLANGLYYWGLARVDAGHAAVIASIEPAVAAMLALVVFGQRLELIGWAGVGLVVAGILTGSIGSGGGMPVAPVDPPTSNHTREGLT